MPKTIKERFNKYYCSNKGRVMHLLNNARGRARRYNLSFDLDYNFIKSKLDYGFCEVSGLPFILKTNGGKGHKTNSFSPSIDRKDNSKGYTKDNVQLVCWIYNRAKGAFPIEDLILLVNALTTEDLSQTPKYPSSLSLSSSNRRYNSSDQENEDQSDRRQSLDNYSNG